MYALRHIGHKRSQVFEAAEGRAADDFAAGEAGIFECGKQASSLQFHLQEQRKVSGSLPGHVLQGKEVATELGQSGRLVAALRFSLAWLLGIWDAHSVIDRRIRVSRLSAIVITRNEAAKIADCLDSLAFCDERIVVDCGSADDTVARALAHGARVEHHVFEGFGSQKNFALSLASGEWVLSVDADERVSPALAAEITTAIDETGVDGFEMPRSSSFLGRAMRHSGWYPDYVLRVFRRGRARFSDHVVHERVVCEGPVRRLQEPLLHFPVDRIEDALSRVDRYSSAGAEQMVASGRRVTFASGFLHGVWTFVRTYVLRAGFLDGREGLLLAIANAEGAFYRYMKAWLLTRQGNRADSRADGGAMRR